MAGMVSRLSALDVIEHKPKPGDFSGPKPNALRDFPQEEPIPPLPSPLKGYPTPWLTEYDVLSYVYPLYTRGWGQSLKLWKPKTEHEKPRYTMLLSARYRFEDYESATSFFLKIAAAATAENHHPSVHVENASPFTVTVATQTDSAKRPTWVEETVQQASEPPALILPSPTTIPGITLRDVRLAILVEDIYSTEFASHLTALGRHVHPTNFRLSWFTMERIWKRQVLLPGRETGRRERRRLFVEMLIKHKLEKKKPDPQNIKCYACGGDHHLNDCTKREHIAPRHSCHYCKEMHWSIDCPVRVTRYIRRWQFAPDAVHY